MAWRNENRLNIRSCAQTESNHLLFTILICAECAPFFIWRIKREKRRLRTSDSRNIQNDTDIGGQPHLPRMRNSISIYQGDMGLVLQFSEGPDKRHALAEIQKSGDIRDPHFPNLLYDLDGIELRKSQDDNNSPDQSFTLLVAKICSSDAGDFSNVPFQDKLRSQSLLDSCRFF